MLLCIDAGNTRLKWGLHDGAGWRALGVLDYRQLDAADTPAAWRDAGIAWLANVAGDAVGDRLARHFQACGIALRTVVPEAACAGVRNGYRVPAQLGPDRWAALIGARALHRGASLVVCAGTATTVDLLQADGLFAGGIILPGFDMMRRSLAGNTAALPLAQGPFALHPLSTEEAIFSGCLHAQAGAIERMFELLGDRRDASCLLAGGARQALLPLLDIPVRETEHLVLEGLVHVAAEMS